MPEVKFPAASTVIALTAATGTGPVGSKIIPVTVNPQSPAALTVDQLGPSTARPAAAKLKQSVAMERITSVLRAMLRFMDLLLLLFPASYTP